ncbi:MAG: YqgE/AlgH family protein [Pirellulales bacterium]|nr:YqgE/AlgH family protein [Pirellulales bacterium]
MKTLVGQLLIAVPQLLDPNFRQTVVLIVRHNDEGAVGLVLNRQAPLKFNTVWEKLCNEPCPLEAPLYVGGPCGGPLMALHQIPDQSEIEVLPELYFTSDIQQIREVLEQQADPLRLFGGYAGWGPGQLEDELNAGGWHVHAAEPAQIFAANDALWESLIRGMRGKSQLADWLGIKHIPPAPWLN